MSQLTVAASTALTNHAPASGAAAAAVKDLATVDFTFNGGHKGVIQVHHPTQLKEFLLGPRH